MEAKRTAFEDEAKKIEGELGRLVSLFAAGEGGDVVKDAIAQRTRRLADVKAQLEHLDGERTAARLDAPKVKAELEKRLTDWQAIILSQPVKARQILRKLLAGRLALTPVEGGYRFHGKAVLGRALEGVAGAESFHNQACREGGSNPHELALKGF